MDVLVSNKATGQVSVMTEPVFGLNGGTEIYDILDYEGTDTYKDRLKDFQNVTVLSDVKPDAMSRLNNASQLQGVIPGNSSIITEPGKNPAVVVTNEGQQQPILPLPLTTPGLKIEPTAAPATPAEKLKVVTLSDLDEPTNEGNQAETTGNVQTQNSQAQTGDAQPITNPESATGQTQTTGNGSADSTFVNEDNSSDTGRVQDVTTNVQSGEGFSDPKPETNENPGAEGNTTGNQVKEGGDEKKNE